MRQWRLLLPGNGQDQKKSDKATVAQRPRKTWNLRSAISVSILAFSAVDENGKANLPPKNWSRYNVRVRIDEGGVNRQKKLQT